MRTRDFDAWIEEYAVPLDAASYEPSAGDAARLDAIVDEIAGARLIFLGETNHFVHEKTAFRNWWIRRLAARRSLVIGEELSWSDGHDVAAYLRDGDESHLDRLATFGDERHVREDRDDRPTGIFADSFETYPAKLFGAEQCRFYRTLRANGVVGYFAFDIDAPGTGYEDLVAHRADGRIPESFWQRCERVAGESIEAEADRLETALALLPAGARELRVDVEAMVGSLRYTALAYPAASYEALRPAMALRESLMTRHVRRELDRLDADASLVLLSHAFHLAKDDHAIHGEGVGPGGDRVPSLGHHLVCELGLHARSVWMVYAAGEDSQPMADLPRTANYPKDSLNARLRRRGVPLVVPCATAPDAEVGLGHMYNSVARVHLRSQADAIFFIPRVSPMQF